MERGLFLGLALSVALGGQDRLSVFFDPASIRIFQSVYKATVMELPLCLHGTLTRDGDLHILSVTYVTLADVSPDSISEVSAIGFRCVSRDLVGMAHVHRSTKPWPREVLCLPSELDVATLNHSAWAYIQVIICGPTSLSVWLANRADATLEGVICEMGANLVCDKPILLGPKGGAS